MPRAIVIHAGFHKTGTSSIQQVLRRNRPLLKPHMAIRLKPQMGDLLHATRGYSTWRDPLTLMKAERRFVKLLKGLPGMPRRVLCLSAEELSGHMPGRGDLRDYSAAPVLMARFAKLCAQVFPDCPVSFCFGIRPPADWLRSAWAEHVKSSSMVLDFDDFTTQYAGAANLVDITEAIAAQTACPVHLIDLARHSAAPAAPLLDLCDVPQDVQQQLEPVAPTNTRLPEHVLLDLLGANRAYEDRDARKAAKTAILKAAGL